jgi:hypothetical protein
VSHGETVLGDELLDVGRELEETERVGNGAALLSGAAGDLVVTKVKVVGEPFEGMRDFDGVEILPLDVLDEGDLEEAIIGDVLNEDRDVGDTGEAGGTPAPFAGHELVPAVARSDHEGLNDTVGADGIGEFLEAIRLEDGAGLERIGIDEVHGNPGGVLDVWGWCEGNLGGKLRLGRCAANEQRGKAPTEGFAWIVGCLAHFAGSPWRV